MRVKRENGGDPWYSPACEWDDFEHSGVPRVELSLKWFEPFHSPIDQRMVNFRYCPFYTNALDSFAPRMVC